MVEETKPWWKSLTLWSAVASGVVGGLVAYFGEYHWAVLTVISIFTALGIYGRARATGKLTGFSSKSKKK